MRTWIVEVFIETHFVEKRYVANTIEEAREQAAAAYSYGQIGSIYDYWIAPAEPFNPSLLTHSKHPSLMPE